MDKLTFEKKEYENNKRYFSKITISGAVIAWLVVIGLVLFAIGSWLKGYEEAWLVTVANVCTYICYASFGAVAIYLIACLVAALTRPSDQAYDASVEKYLSQLDQRALTKLGVTKEEVSVDPIRLGGFKFYEEKGWPDLLSQKGKDGHYRSNVYEATNLYFMENDVYCYTTRFCTTESKVSEETAVYFYSDIVTVATGSQENEKGVDVETFKLVTSAGAALEVSILNDPTAESSIVAMRKLIREKKASATCQKPADEPKVTPRVFPSPVEIKKAESSATVVDNDTERE